MNDSGRAAQKTILFFSCEPGGAEVLIPVIRLLTAETPHRIIVWGYGLGAQRFSRGGIEYIEIERVEKKDRSIFDTLQPDLLITSATSMPERDMSEKHLWHIARQLGIPSMAFLDQWQNYAIRFSGSGKNEYLAYLPDYINCIDEIGKAEMTVVGFDPGKLIILGHPYLSAIKDDFGKIDGNSIREQLGILENQKVALFVSEAIQEYYGQIRGYDQYRVLAMFLEAIKERSVHWRPVIKLHPKDKAAKFEQVMESYSQLAPLIVSNEINSLECLKIADLVVGMTSIMLIEAFVLGKNVISAQPDLKIEDPFILSRQGLMPIAKSISDLNLVETAINCNGPEINYLFKKDEFCQIIQEIID